jgi:hypothetical protein
MTRADAESRYERATRSLVVLTTVLAADEPEAARRVLATLREYYPGHTVIEELEDALQRWDDNRAKGYRPPSAEIAEDLS